MLARLLLATEALFRSAKRRAPTEVKQVLILEYMLPLGCCVHLTPLFEALKRCRPDLQLIIATRGLGIQVNRRSTFIDTLIETPDPLTNLREAAIHLRRQLRRLGLQPDCILTGASDQRTRIALLGMLASSGWRGGFTVKPALYHHPLQYDPTLSLIRNNLRLAQLLGCDIPISRPRVTFSRDDLSHATTLLQEANPEGRSLAVIVTQNSGGQSTGWHADRWSTVIQAAQQRGCAVVYVGTAVDQPAIEAISQAAGGIGISIAGKTTIPQLAAVLAQSDIMLTLDTGTMHVGRAIGAPMVVLGPSWQKPLEWLPLGVENVRILRGPDRDDIPPGYHLDEISAASVIAAMDQLLAAHPASAHAREQRLRESLSDADRLVTALPARPAP